MRYTNGLLRKMSGDAAAPDLGVIGIIVDTVPFMENKSDDLRKAFERVRATMQTGGVLVEGPMTPTGFRKSERFLRISCSQCDGFQVRCIARETGWMLDRAVVCVHAPVCLSVWLAGCPSVCLSGWPSSANNRRLGSLLQPAWPSQGHTDKTRAVGALSSRS